MLGGSFFPIPFVAEFIFPCPFWWRFLPKELEGWKHNAFWITFPVFVFHLPWYILNLMARKGFSFFSELERVSSLNKSRERLHSQHCVLLLTFNFLTAWKESFSWGLTKPYKLSWTMRQAMNRADYCQRKWQLPHQKSFNMKPWSLLQANRPASLPPAYT